MRVTRRVEEHIRTTLNHKILAKYHKYEDMNKLVNSVSRDIDARLDTIRTELWKEAEEKYPDLKLMSGSRYGRMVSSHPEVQNENAIKRIADEAISKAVESIAVSLELGAPASQLESLIDEAYRGVLKYIEERTSKIAD